MKIACRAGCAACCIIPSISSPMPLMPQGKLSNTHCHHLDKNNLCSLFGLPERPQVCIDYQATEEFCGHTNQQAYILLTHLNQQTEPL